MLNIIKSSLPFAVTTSVLVAQAPQQQPALLPSDIFFEAHVTLENAKKLQAARQFEKSWQEYYNAMKYYKTLKATHPNWDRIHIVDHRIETTKKAIAAIESDVNAEIQAKKQATAGMIEGREQLGSITPAVGKVAGGASPTTSPSPATGVNHSAVAPDPAAITKASGISKQIQENKEFLKNPEITPEAKGRALAQVEYLKQQRSNLASSALNEELKRKEARIQLKEREINNMVTALRKERLQKVAAERELGEAEKRIALAKIEANELKKQLEKQASSSAAIVKSLHDKLAATEKQLRESNQALSEANKTIADLESKLASADALNKELEAERDALIADNDRLTVLLQKSGGDRIKALVKENMRLVGELKKKTDLFKSVSGDREDEQERLKIAERDMIVAKENLNRLNQRNRAYEKRVKELEQKLKDTNEDLADLRLNPGASNIEIEEAEMNKKTVERLITSQKRRNREEQLIKQYIAKQHGSDKTLTAMFDKLSTFQFKLTTREQAIYDKSKANELTQHSSNLDINTRRRNILEIQKQVHVCRQLAKRNVIRNNYPLAEDFLHNANELLPNDSYVLMDLGYVQIKQNKLAEAEKTFENGIVMKENNPYAHYMLGVTRYRLQNRDGARKSLEKCVQLDPDNINAYVYLGNISAANRDYEDAIKRFDEALLINPDMPEVLYNLSLIHHYQKDKLKAKELYKMSLKAGYAPNAKHERRIGL